RRKHKSGLAKKAKPPKFGQAGSFPRTPRKAQGEFTMTTTTVATITRIVNITWTRAAKVRMTANVDMPEYGLKAQQVFYLVRSSADNNDYYLLVWDYAEVKWDCPCKHSVERPQARTCRHRRLVSADCRARKEAKKANALR